MPDINCRADICKLVNTFYKRALEDEQIGHFFASIKANIDTHLPHIYDFWESVLFGKAIYKRNPMSKHIALNQKKPLEEKDFERWLSIWNESINHLFKGAKAQEAQNKAKQIAVLMQYKIKHQ